MTKEIKFRAWHKTEKLMCEVSTLNENGAFLIGVKKGDDTVSRRYIIVAPEDGRFCPHEDIELLRFTGLFDNNDNPVYEGHIVKGNHKDNFVIIPMLGGLSILNTHFYGQTYNELVSHPVNEVQTATWIKDSEIIGNIYSNHNLLKKQ
jgi:uncharacterized phage protein (TIGR01671 family)